MNWLIIGIPLLIFYLIWTGYLMSKRKFNKSLLVIAFAHLPYLLINVVAPFRGALDPEYAGYVFGWIQVPPGPGVTAVVGTIVLCSFIILTKSLKNELEKMWSFTLVFDLTLFIMAVFPNLLDIFKEPTSMNIMLGEYLTIPSVVTIPIILLLFAFPMVYSIYYSARNVFGQFSESSGETSLDAE